MVQKIIYKTKDYCKVKFTFGTGNAERIEIFGLNNTWQKPLKMKKRKDGKFIAETNLPKGSSHEFKYLVNQAEWLNDDDADREVPNMYGGTNGVIEL